MVIYLGRGDDADRRLRRRGQVADSPDRLHALQLVLLLSGRSDPPHCALWTELIQDVLGSRPCSLSGTTSIPVAEVSNRFAAVSGVAYRLTLVPNLV